MIKEDYEQLMAELNRQSRELKVIRELVVRGVNDMINAETEVPEKMRRFVQYMHDVHDISYMYEERGLPVPPHIHREMERCDDRFRQLVAELHLDGGTFERVRREMASDPDNRWDHTRLLTRRGECYAAGPSINGSIGPQSGTEPESSECGESVGNGSVHSVSEEGTLPRKRL